MMGGMTVNRQLGIGLNGPTCIKLDPFSNDSHKGIWCAGVVYESKAHGFVRGVDREMRVDFYDGNVCLPLGTSSTFSLRNAFSRKLSNFLSGPQGNGCKQPLSFNVTGSDLHGDWPFVTITRFWAVLGWHVYAEYSMMPMTMESGPAKCSTRVSPNPASFSQALQSTSV